ncbi:MAG: histidine--tRNA ligase [Parcubacteria group bacterium]|nr:histidine--tRNA ligase [Parcubacteria group bacterium]
MKFQTPTGMHDILEEDLVYFKKIQKACESIAGFYGFKEIQTPILEQTEIFEKGTGATSDIVQKEMYSLRTKGGDHLTLRPEGTPGVVRAYIQHGMQNAPKPVNMWYMGPFFRHERPQAGRYRQFNQFGFESLGVVSPIIDALIIQIFYVTLQSLGFKDLMVELNSIGCSQCRPYFKKSFNSYLRSHQSSLCADCKQRAKKNPLRIFDCKQEKCQSIKNGAPQVLDSLCKPCHEHFKAVLEFLDELDLPYSLNPYLVRGLDYYTRTVFEIMEQTKNGESQGSLVGGGRYDNLAKTLGGKDTPACGGAAGVERIVNLMKKRQKKAPTEGVCQVFLAQVGELGRKKSLKLLEDCRALKLNVGHALHKDSLSSQLRTADTHGCKYVMILGQKEALENKVIIREMETGKQKTVALDKAAKEIKKRIA